MVRLSGITPSGEVHLGNYLGAIKRWADHAGRDDLYFVSNMHAMTVQHSPERLRELTDQQLAVLIAAGVPPRQLFVQSDLVREHMALAWLLECTCTFGEARRMTQFKEKSQGSSSVRLGLLTYPVLMASDILLHGTAQVPVGEDQNQHVELARTLARRFNHDYGDVFVVPDPVLPDAGARVRDLSEPAKKMSKSNSEGNGIIYILDDPESNRRKFHRAVTDSLNNVNYSPEDQPGVANLLDILAVCTGTTPTEMAESIDNYRDLKVETADAVLDLVTPVRERALELLDNRNELARIRSEGAQNARERSRQLLEKALELAGIG